MKRLLACCLLLAGCYEEPAVSESHLVITTSATSAVADGSSVIEIDIQLLDVGRAFGQTVTLTSTLGTFANGEKTTSLKTDSQGKTTTTLKSGAAGMAMVQFNLKDQLIVYREFTFTKVELDPSDVLTVTVNKDSVEADGASTFTITAALSGPKSDYAGKDITFSSSAGTFENGQASLGLKTNGAGMVTVRLKHSVVTWATLTVNAQNALIHTRPIRFYVAAPHEIVLSTSSFQGTSGPANPMTITAILRRTTGQPTAGFIPSFSANDDLGNPIGQFGAPTVDGNTVRVTFIVPTTTFQGQVFFNAYLVTPVFISTSYGPVYYKQGP